MLIKHCFGNRLTKTRAITLVDDRMDFGYGTWFEYSHQHRQEILPPNRISGPRTTDKLLRDLPGLQERISVQRP